MPAAKLTKAEVSEALDEFRRQGRPRPGLHKLREAIGHGSLARIKRLIQEIDLETVDRLAPEMIAKLPDPISVAAARAWIELESAADELQNSMEANLHKAQAVMHDEVQGLRSELAKRVDALKQAETKLQEAQSELAERAAECSQLRGELDRSSTEETRLRGEINAQARAAADRETRLNALLDQERKESEVQAQAARGREEHLQGKLDALREQFANARESHVAYASATEAEAAAAKRRVETLESQLSVISKERETLRETNHALGSDLARVDARHDAQASTLMDVRAELKEAKRTIETLRTQKDVAPGRKTWARSQARRT